MTQNIEDQIQKLKQEIKETPYHKATEHHIGRLKAKIAKLKTELYERQTKGRGGGGGFALSHSGNASLALVGFPSVGKSTLLNALTNARSKVAPYEFTTLTVIPGMLYYQGAYIQIFDIPGLITGAASGRGKGRQVLAVARNVDLILTVIDAQKPRQLNQIIQELHQAGIRPNQFPPDLKITKKDRGGIIFHSQVKQEFSSQTAINVAQELGLKNAEIVLKQPLSLDQLIDALHGNRAYLPTLTVFNRTDTLSPAASKKLKDQFPQSLFISATKKQHLDALKTAIWQKLNLVRIYLVHPGQKQPDYAAPLIVKKGDTLKDVAEKLASQLKTEAKLAKISGPGAAYPGQKVPLTTKVQDQIEATFL